MPVIDRASMENVIIKDTADAAGTAAGRAAADVLAAVLERQPRARVVFASAPSQDQAVRTLAADPRIDWSRVQSLHLDEYRGIDPGHPAAFGRWLADRLPQTAQQGLDRIRTRGESADEVHRYGELLAAGPIDLVLLGIGVNGHIAFNEPGDTDFEDSAAIREVLLTHESRQQQVDEGLFPILDEVPTHALTMTVPAILAATTVVGTVLGEAKARSVAAALTGPLTTDVPASSLRTHPHMVIHLDAAAAGLLPAELRSGTSPAAE